MHKQYPIILLVQKSKTLKLANALGLALGLLAVSDVFNWCWLYLDLRFWLRVILERRGFYTYALTDNELTVQL